ncbi:MAG: hypothetical protein KGH85_07455 [Thaumarchaeota archaeon]|nr:hypothetical protein [Nitrososphaerota archaeon]
MTSLASSQERYTKTLVKRADSLTKKVHSKYGLRTIKDPVRCFYCEWLPENTPKQRKFKVDNKKRYHVDHKCCWNHWVGLPTLKFANSSESEGVPLNRYEQRLIEFNQSTNYYALNKCRGAGASEIKTVRWDAFYYSILNKTPGRKGLTMAGLNMTTSTKFLHRVKQLCDLHPELYLVEPKSDYPSQIFFAQGGSLWAMPAVPNSVRSLENVGDVNIEEAAFWEKVDDEPVLHSVEPHVAKSGTRISNISTPNGKRGYFWNKIFEPEMEPPTKYLKHVLNWREVVGIPEPDPEVLSDYDMSDFNVKDKIKKTYLHLYKADKQYKAWFDGFFGGRSIFDIMDVSAPILDIKEIVNMYEHDRSEYDQELDNQFITTENKAFGSFVEKDFAPIEFSDIEFEEV